MADTPRCMKCLEFIKSKLWVFVMDSSQLILLFLAKEHHLNNISSNDQSFQKGDNMRVYEKLVSLIIVIVWTHVLHVCLFTKELLPFFFLVTPSTYPRANIRVHLNVHMHTLKRQWRQRRQSWSCTWEEARRICFLAVENSLSRYARKAQLSLLSAYTSPTYNHTHVQRG